MNKILVGTKESAGAVIWRCSVNKIFRKIAQNSQKNIFLMKFQASRPANLLKSDSSEGVFF